MVSVLEKEVNKFLCDIKIQTDHLGRPARPSNSQQKKKKKKIEKNRKKGTCRIVRFTVSADHRVELKEGDEKDKYLDLQGNWENFRAWK